MRAPSEKQIKLADMIAETLDVDFPQSSEEFTACTYYEFIHSHIDKLMNYSFNDYYEDMLDEEMVRPNPSNQ